MKLTKEQIFEVNSSIDDKATYLSDAEQYGTIEYWSDLKVQTNGRKLQGDCEDYCISKLHGLLKLQADISDCQFVLVNSSGNEDILYDHCVLKVTDDCDQEWMLDQRYPERGAIKLELYPDIIYGWGMGSVWKKVEKY